MVRPELCPAGSPLRRPRRRGWLLGAGVALGSGAIWSMHSALLLFALLFAGIFGARQNEPEAEPAV